MLSEGFDMRRSVLSELSAIVSGLQTAIRDEMEADNDARIPSTSNSSTAQLRPAHKRLSHLSHALSSLSDQLDHLDQRVSSNVMMRYTPNENRFLRRGTDAHPQPSAHQTIYSASTTHLDLTRIHELESEMAHCHEQILKCYSNIAAMEAMAPMQLAAQEWQDRRSLMRAAPSSSSSPITISMHLQSLLDSLRTCAFDLQSLGVWLPSHTAFIQSHLAPSDIPGREWRWLHAFEQYVEAKRSQPGKPASVASTLSNIFKRAQREEQAVSLRYAMYEHELAAYRKIQDIMLKVLTRTIRRTEETIHAFHTQNNALYADATEQLDDVVQDWQRNNNHTNVQRLLTTLQSVWPCLQQLLTYRHSDRQRHGARDGNDDDDGDGDVNVDGDDGRHSSRLPRVVLRFQREVASIREEMKQQIEALQQQLNELRHEANHAWDMDLDANEGGGSARSPISARVNEHHSTQNECDVAPSCSSRPASSRGRGQAPIPLSQRPPFQI